MQRINRLLVNICSDKLQESKKFYTNLFDFEVDYDSDWFVHLISKDKNLEIGIIERNNEIVPIASKGQANGFYVTLVVDKIAVCHEKAQSQGLEIIQAPEDTFYGQRRMLLKDPNGVLVDVSSHI